MLTVAEATVNQRFWNPKNEIKAVLLLTYIPSEVHNMRSTRSLIENTQCAQLALVPIPESIKILSVAQLHVISHQTRSQAPIAHTVAIAHTCIRFFFRGFYLSFCMIGF